MKCVCRLLDKLHTARAEQATRHSSYTNEKQSFSEAACCRWVQVVNTADDKRHQLCVRIVCLAHSKNLYALNC